MTDPARLARAETATRLLARIRKGDVDPRPAAVLLGEAYDQDFLVGVLEDAAAYFEPTAEERNAMSRKLLDDIKRFTFLK